MCVVRGSDNLIWDGGGGLFIPPSSSSSSLWRSGSFCSPSGRQLRHQLPPPPQQRPPRPEGGGSCRSTPARVRPALPPPAAGSLLGSFFAAGEKNTGGRRLATRKPLPVDSSTRATFVLLFCIHLFKQTPSSHSSTHPILGASNFSKV